MYIGIDWSQLKHDVCFLNEAGAPIARVVLAHRPAGFARLEAHRQQLGVSPADCRVGIETAHNLVIDYLWGHGYTQVCVIQPSRKAMQRHLDRIKVIVHAHRGAPQAALIAALNPVIRGWAMNYGSTAPHVSGECRQARVQPARPSGV